MTVDRFSHAQLPISMATERRQKSLRNLTILAMAALLLAAMVIVPILVPTQAFDAETVAAMADTTNSADAFDGYATVALIYAYTSKIIQFGITFGLGVALISAFIWWLRVPRILVLAMFCLITPISLYLGFFTKDTFTTPVAIFSILFLVSKRLPAWLKILAVAFAYTVYAFLFRQYYLLIIGIWIAILIFIKARWNWRVVIILMVPLIMLAVPSEIYNALQEPRDIVNIARAGFAGAGNRTAFLNLVRPDGLETFVINFVYASARLNFPIFNPGIKEFFLFGNLCIYGWLMVTGLRSGNHNISWPAALFLAHVLVLTIFEPDLGSYLRHLSTALLLLMPSLVMHDRLFQQRMRPLRRNSTAFGTTPA